ncbi:dienelactone hydrolase [Streptomyces sp. NE5-10]|nr:dienelactone hydrolase [Streptomyces sp. NE5-10]
MRDARGPPRPRPATVNRKEGPAISTTSALSSTTLPIPTPDGVADAFVARPDDGRRHPGVLLYGDAFGVRPELEERARELAGHGYHVVVPHLYYRQGPAPVIDLPAHIGAEIRPAVVERLLPFLEEALVTERIVRDAGAHLEFLTERPETSPGSVAVIGYCIGGALALRAGTAYPDVVAAVAGFHPGFLVTDAPDSPHLGIPALAAEVHLGLSGNDMAPEAIATLEDAFSAAGVRSTVEVYPGTVHGFTMADTDALHPAGRRLHWDRLLALLARNLPSAA